MFSLTGGTKTTALQFPKSNTNISEFKWPAIATTTTKPPLSWSNPPTRVNFGHQSTKTKTDTDARSKITRRKEEVSNDIDDQLCSAMKTFRLDNSMENKNLRQSKPILYSENAPLSPFWTQQLNLQHVKSDDLPLPQLAANATTPSVTQCASKKEMQPAAVVPTFDLSKFTNTTGGKGNFDSAIADVSIKDYSSGRKSPALTRHSVVVPLNESQFSQLVKPNQACLWSGPQIHKNTPNINTTKLSLTLNTHLVTNNLCDAKTFKFQSSILKFGTVVPRASSSSRLQNQHKSSGKHIIGKRENDNDNDNNNDDDDDEDTFGEPYQGVAMKKPLQLLPHQEITVNWIRYREGQEHHGIRGGIVSLKMGLGKTPTTLWVVLKDLQEQKAQRIPAPTLIVCSSSLMRNWWKIGQQFFGSKLRILVYHPKEISTAEFKNLTIAQVCKYDVIVTSYHMIKSARTRLQKLNNCGLDLRMREDTHTNNKKNSNESKEIARLRGLQQQQPQQQQQPKGKLLEGDMLEYLVTLRGPVLLIETPWFRVVADESQTIAKVNGKLLQAATCLQAPRKLCLTGTAFRNKATDPFCQFEFLGFNGLNSAKQGSANAFKYFKLRECVLMMDYEQAGVKLPPKFALNVKVELCEEARLLYECVWRLLANVVEAVECGRGSMAHVLSVFTRLRQICIAPYLLHPRCQELTIKNTPWVSKGILDLKAEKENIKLKKQHTSKTTKTKPKKTTKKQEEKDSNDNTNDDVHEANAQMEDEEQPGASTAFAEYKDMKNEAEMLQKILGIGADDQRTLGELQQLGTWWGDLEGSSGIMAMKYNASASLIDTALKQPPDDPPDRQTFVGLFKHFVIPDVSVDEHVKKGEPDNQVDEGEDDLSVNSGKETWGLTPKQAEAKEEIAYRNAYKRWEEHKGDPNKIIIFSTGSRDLILLALRLRHEGYPEGSVVMVDGTLKPDEREAQWDRFRNVPECVVLLMTYKVGSEGVTLIEANSVVPMNPWWCPSVELQAIARLYRIGQARVVRVYYIIAEKTIEDRIVNIGYQKNKLSDQMLGTHYAQEQESVQETDVGVGLDLIKSLLRSSA